MRFGRQRLDLVTMGERELQRIDAYAEGPAQYQARALSEPTLREVILALFRNTVEFLTESRHPSGCMTLTGAMACSVEAKSA
jgi:hypothetical protein